MRTKGAWIIASPYVMITHHVFLTAVLITNIVIVLLQLVMMTMKICVPMLIAEMEYVMRHAESSAKVVQKTVEGVNLKKRLNLHQKMKRLV